MQMEFAPMKKKGSRAAGHDDWKRVMKTEVKFRIPINLRQKVEKAAHKAGRSMNAELLARVEESFAAADTRAVIEATANAVVARMKEEIT
jgi:Arc-like DNA binding domain